MIVVVAANDREWAPWRRLAGVRDALRPGQLVQLKSEAGPIALLATGMGLDDASSAAAKLLELRPRFVLHVGFAGGVRTGMSAGDVLMVTGTSAAVHDVDSGEALPPVLPVDEAPLGPLRHALAQLPDRFAQGGLLTVSRFVDRAEAKAELGTSFVYLACEMEAHAVVEATHAAGATYVGVRAISDPVEHDVPPSPRNAAGRISLRRTARWAAAPASSVEVARMLSGGRKAQVALGRAIPAALGALEWLAMQD